MFHLLPALEAVWKHEQPGLYIANKKKRLAHLLIPKNASTSMRVLLRPFKWYREKHPAGRELLTTCVRFAVVREPFRRFVSSFNEIDERLHRPGYDHKLIRMQPFARVKDVDQRFRQFAEDVCRGIFDNHLVQQTRHVRATKLKVTEWMVHERLGVEFPRFMKRHGLTGSVPHAKKNPRAKRNRRLLNLLVHSERLVKIVRHVYAEDFKLYRRIAHD